MGGDLKYKYRDGLSDFQVRVPVSQRAKSLSSASSDTVYPPLPPFRFTFEISACFQESVEQMVATESQDVLNRRFVSDFASVLGFFNTLLVVRRTTSVRRHPLRRGWSEPPEGRPIGRVPR